MIVIYKKLWKLLIDRDMMKKDQREQAGLTTNVIAKMWKNENVSTEVLCKICNALNCKVDDIVDFIPDGEDESNKSLMEERQKYNCFNMRRGGYDEKEAFYQLQS